MILADMTEPVKPPDYDPRFWLKQALELLGHHAIQAGSLNSTLVLLYQDFSQFLFQLPQLPLHVA